MQPLIKICGITRSEDIMLCEECGVDFIGFNFVPSSPRCITEEQAAHLRFISRTLKVVGVFQDHPLDDVVKIARRLSLDVIQLHGEESLDAMRLIPFPIIKAFRSIPDEFIIRAHLSAGIRVLLDGRSNGHLADWEAIAALPIDIRHNVMLAGGLHADNVSEALAVIKPFAVDVASGVESEPGIKDGEKLRMFVDAVRGTVKNQESGIKNHEDAIFSSHNS